MHVNLTQMLLSIYKLQDKNLQNILSDNAYPDTITIKGQANIVYITFLKTTKKQKFHYLQVIKSKSR